MFRMYVWSEAFYFAYSQTKAPRLITEDSLCSETALRITSVQLDVTSVADWASALELSLFRLGLPTHTRWRRGFPAPSKRFPTGQPLQVLDYPMFKQIPVRTGNFNVTVSLRLGVGECMAWRLRGGNVKFSPSTSNLAIALSSPSACRRISFQRIRASASLSIGRFVRLATDNVPHACRPFPRQRFLWPRLFTSPPKELEDSLQGWDLLNIEQVHRYRKGCFHAAVSNRFDTFRANDENVAHVFGDESVPLQETECALRSTLRTPVGHALWNSTEWAKGDAVGKPNLTLVAVDDLLQVRICEGGRFVPCLGEADRSKDFKTEWTFHASGSMMGSMGALWQLIEQFGALDHLDIIEVGAGFGLFAFLVLTFFDIGSYTIVDLPEPLALQARYLNETLPTHERGKITFVEPAATRDAARRKYDIFVSFAAYSELDLPSQRQYWPLLKASSGGMIIDNRYHAMKLAQRRENTVSAKKWLDHLEYSGLELADKLLAEGFDVALTTLPAVTGCRAHNALVLSITFRELPGGSEPCNIFFQQTDVDIN